MTDREPFKVKGDSDGRWDAEFSTMGRLRVFGEVKRCEWVLDRNGRGEPRLQVKAYYRKGEARDCDGWQLRVFQCDIYGPTIEYAESGYITASGFAEGIKYLTDAETEAEGFIEDGYVDSCFPPTKIRSSGRNDTFMRVEVVLTLRSK